MRKVIKIAASILFIFILIAGGFLFYFSRGLNDQITLSGIDLSDVNDGIYTGNYESGRWSNELSITVIDNKITDIEVVDDIMLSQDEVRDTLFDKVIESQNTDVDTISQATVTSKAYLKSIENALDIN